jgi:transposase
MKPEKFKNYYIGTNKLFFPEFEFVIKLSFPRVFVSYKRTPGYYTDFEKFFKNVAEVQYLEGEKPPKSEQQQIMNDIWNYLTMEKSANKDDFITG